MPRQGRRDDRSAEAEAWRKLYKTARWRGPKGVRTRQLAEHPLCAMCAAAGRTTAATVCDHVDPKNKATEEGFFAGPFQSLCDAAPWRCHSRVKQREESRGYRVAVGVDGFPLDPRHRALR